MKIELTKGLVAVIDDEDFALISKYTWSASLSSRYAYAMSVDKVTKKKVSMHRLITNCPDNMLIDHINGNTLDNRKENLRLCTKSQNAANNSIALNKFKGVFKRKGLWETNIKYNGRSFYLGTYKTPLEAAMYYDAVAVYFFREFAAINFPEFKEEYLRQAEELDEVENEEC